MPTVQIAVLRLAGRLTRCSSSLGRRRPRREPGPPLLIYGLVRKLRVVFDQAPDKSAAINVCQREKRQQPREAAQVRFPPQNLELSPHQAKQACHGDPAQLPKPGGVSVKHVAPKHLSVVLREPRDHFDGRFHLEPHLEVCVEGKPRAFVEGRIAGVVHKKQVGFLLGVDADGNHVRVDMARCICQKLFHQEKRHGDDVGVHRT